jgi:dipeptidyl-peptidase-4
MLRLLLLALSVVAFAAPALPAQPRPLDLETVLTEADSFAPVLPKVQWVPGTTLLSEVTEGRTGPYVVLRDPTRGDAREHGFSAAELGRALLAAGCTNAVETALPEFQWLDRTRVRVVEGEVVYHWVVGSERAMVRNRLIGSATATEFAADDALVACQLDADLWILKADGTRRRITWDGRPGDLEYGGVAHRQEFGIMRGMLFDPSGRRLAFYREDLRPIATYPYVDYTQSPPAAKHGRYPMAGRAHARVQVGIYDSRDDSVRWLASEPDADLYWTNLKFTPSGEQLLVALVNRGQDQLELTRFDCATGAREAVLLREHDAQWVEPECGPWFEPGNNGRFLWKSARDGFHHMYRYAADGQLLGQVTRGSFDVVDVLGFAADGQTALVEAHGPDPRHTHVYRASLAGGALQPLTAAPGAHLGTANHDASLLLVRTSTLQSPGNLRVLDASGKQLLVLAEATTRWREFTMPQQRWFDVRGGDGTVLHGKLLLPAGFDEQRQYPLLLYVYGGPHSQLVNDSWWLFGARELWLAWLADQGCIVATIDNRGTKHRGIEFEQVVHRRLGQPEVDDQVAAVRHLASLSFVDAQRIGVHGWSFGGYLTLRLMQAAPELFACGVSGAPVTDWRQYETGYTERYLDTPDENPDGYAAASALAGLERLRGRLLLVHGSDDRTVMLSHAVSFLDEAVRQGALVEHMLYPMQTHGFSGASRQHLYRLLSRFFAEHLLRPAAAPRR